MSDPLKTAVTAVSLQVLKALARLWLDANVGAGEARALARLAHVLVAHEQAQRGADRFVDELSQHGILLVSDQPLIDSSPSPEHP